MSRHRSSSRNSRILNNKGNAARTTVDRLAQELGPYGLTVQANGHGFRIECNRCHWSSTSGVVQLAIDHAATH